MLIFLEKSEIVRKMNLKINQLGIKLSVSHVILTNSAKHQIVSIQVTYKYNKNDLPLNRKTLYQ